MKLKNNIFSPSLPQVSVATVLISYVFEWPHTVPPLQDGEEGFASNEQIGKIIMIMS